MYFDDDYFVKNKNGIIRGENARFDASGCRLTPKLRAALEALDGESIEGARWDITREGRYWCAAPDGPYDQLYFKGGKWTDGYED